MDADPASGREVRVQDVTNDPALTMYLPQAQVPDPLTALNLESRPMAWVVRTSESPSTVSADLQEELRLATGVPVTDVATMADIVSISTSRQRLNMYLMTVFGASALLLAAIRIYGLMAYSVQQRRQEIGIRMAMGADAGPVGRMVVGQGMTLVLIGLAVGLGAAYFLATVPAAFLFEVEPRDPAVSITVGMVLTLVALAAVGIPALRAGRVHPLKSPWSGTPRR